MKIKWPLQKLLKLWSCDAKNSDSLVLKFWLYSTSFTFTLSRKKRVERYQFCGSQTVPWSQNFSGQKKDYTERENLRWKPVEYTMSFEDAVHRKGNEKFRELCSEN